MNSTNVESERCCDYFNPVPDVSNNTFLKKLKPDNMKEIIGTMMQRNSVQVSFMFSLVICSFALCFINNEFYWCLLNLFKAGGVHIWATCICRYMYVPWDRVWFFTVQVRDKRPTHMQNARTIFAYVRVLKNVCRHAHLHAFDARVSFCYSLS